MMNIKNKKYVIGIVVIVAGLASLLLAATKSSMISYLNVRDISTSSAVLPGRVLQITGVVKPGSIAQNETTDEVRFLLEDKDSSAIEVPVVYSGILPDEFKPGLTVVVQGTVRNRKLVDANRILTKCASKYNQTITKGGAAS